MRRHDREITDRDTIYEILKEAEYGTLSMCGYGKPYAVPISCAFFLEHGEPYLCWHGAPEGTKESILKTNPEIVYSCVAECRRDFAPERLHWSFFYRSACVSGCAEEVTELPEKKRLLHLLLQHYGENRMFPFPEEMLKNLAVWKCRLNSVTGKRHEEKK